VKPETVSNSRQGRGGCGLKRGSRIKKRKREDEEEREERREGE
jgi:hypothetical protein